MRHEVYEDLDVKEDLSVFEFSSIGVHGIILKRVEFMATGLNDVFNLGFGDIGTDGEINDHSVSDNGDRNKVLATVVHTIFKYTERYPDRFIFFTGSSKGRNRLYRMAIDLNLDELLTLFDIFIFVGDDIMPFMKNTEATSFLLKRKFHNFSL